MLANSHGKSRARPSVPSSWGHVLRGPHSPLLLSEPFPAPHLLPHSSITQVQCTHKNKIPDPRPK